MDHLNGRSMLNDDNHNNPADIHIGDDYAADIQNHGTYAFFMVGVGFNSTLCEDSSHVDVGAVEAVNSNVGLAFDGSFI